MRIDGSDKPHGLRDVVASVLAAAFGVQSSKNRERDFQHGSPRQFIVIGIIATILFIAAVYLAVRLVLRVAGV
jgi:divalent metal cation (Fe/Co/Zn/Cd) transporter